MKENAEKKSFIRTQIESNKETFTEKMITLLEHYVSPSYGSMSKRDFDIMLFDVLHEIGLFGNSGESPKIYDVIKCLKISRSKANNLIYESELRKNLDESSLKNKMVKLLSRPTYAKNGDMILLKVENPCLRDYIKKCAGEVKNGILIDGSFSSEIIRLSAESYLVLIGEFAIDEECQKKIKQQFVKLNLCSDDSFAGIMKAVLKSAGKTVAAGVGENLIDEIFDKLGKIIRKDEGVLDKIPESFMEIAKKIKPKKMLLSSKTVV